MEDILKKLLGNVVEQAPKRFVTPYVEPKKDPVKSLLQDVYKDAEKKRNEIMSRNPFLANLRQDTTKLASDVGRAASTFVADRARDVSDAATGKLRPTADDYMTGATRVARGVGEVAQAVNEGSISFGKSLQEGLFGKDVVRRTAPSSRAGKAFLESIAGTDDIKTAQDYMPAIEEYATRRGATPDQAKTFGALGFFGIMAANNPLFAEVRAGKPLFELAEDAIIQIAKTEDTNIIKQVLVNEGIDEATAVKLAPAFKYADKPKQVAGVVEDIKNGVRIAEEFAANDEVAGATLRERGFGKTVADEAPEMGTTPELYVQRNTDQLATKAANLVREDIAAAEARAMSNDLSDDVVAVASELLKEYRRLAGEATSDAAREVFNKKFADLSRETARKLTEAGRYAQAATILKNQTPEGKVRFALRTIEENNAKKSKGQKKQKELTDEEVTKIRTTYEEIDKMPEGKEKDMAFAKAEEELSKRINPAPWYKKITSFWKAGLLTGLKTTGLNFASTAFNTGLEALSRIPAVGTDIITSLITKQRGVSLASELSRKLDTFIRTGKKDKTGFVEGAEKGWTYLKTGYDERRMRDMSQMAKVDYGDSPVGKAMTAYVDSVFKVVGAGDFPFFYGVRASSMFDQATVAAKNAGLKGKEAKSFIDDLLKNPTDEMIENATADAMIATFTNDTALGRVGVAIQTAIPGVGEIVVPFARTPGAVAMQVINYSPAGPVLEAAKQIRKGTFTQRDFSKAMGRGITGTGMMYLGYLMYQNGQVSLNREKTERGQKLAELEGRRANAIKFGDKWVGASTFGPAGFQAILGGYLARGMEEKGSVVSAVMETVIGMGTVITEQSMMQGLERAMSAISDPERQAESYVESLIGSVIPTIVADTANAIDPRERETPGIFDTFKMRTPLWRETLTPKVNTFGEPLGLTPEEERDAFTRGTDIAGAFLDFTRSTQAKSTPVIEELKRLKKAGYDATPTKLGTNKGYDALSAEENYRLWVGTGRYVRSKLDKLVEMEKYQAMDPEAKKKTIDNIAEEAKDQARAAWVSESTAGLGKEELMQTLKAYRESGLLTERVFNIWKASL